MPSGDVSHTPDGYGYEYVSPKKQAEAGIRYALDRYLYPSQAFVNTDAWNAGVTDFILRRLKHIEAVLGIEEEGVQSRVMAMEQRIEDLEKIVSAPEGSVKFFELDFSKVRDSVGEETWEDVGGAVREGN